MKRNKTPYKVKAVDPSDNQYKEGSVVNEWFDFEGKKCDIVFEGKTIITKGILSKYIIKKD